MTTIPDPSPMAEPSPRLEFFQARLYRFTTPSNLGPWRAVVLDRQPGPPALRSVDHLIGAWYALVWQHNHLVPVRETERLVTMENWREFSLAVTPTEWYRTEAWMKRREVCPDAFVYTPLEIDEIELNRWKTSLNRR